MQENAANKFLIWFNIDVEILHFGCYNTPKPIDIIHKGQNDSVITADNIMITGEGLVRII